MVRTIPTLYWEPPSPKENDDDDDDIDPSGSKLSSGMSHLLSYTVAIIVEGLHYLQKNHTSSSSSTILENTVRTLLPTICAMMMGGSSNSSNSSRNNRNTALDDVEEFHSWGYLIATTMMETMGCWLSTTVTPNVHELVLPAASVAVNFTVVKPTGNDEPLDGPPVCAVLTPVQLSVPTGEVNV